MSKNKGNKYDMVMQLHTSNESFRPHMQRINNGNNGFAYASDSFTVIKVDENLLGRTYNVIDEWPNAEKIYSQHKSKEVFEFTTDNLISELARIENTFLYETETCVECRGEGEVVCECCGNDTECKDCDGEGEVESQNQFARLEYIGEEKVMFNGVCLTPRLLQRIMFTALILGAKSISMSVDFDPRKGILMKFEEGVDVVVMPRLID